MSHGRYGSDTRAGAGTWAAAFALIAALALTLISLQLFQFTSRSTADPALRRALNALVEGNALVDRNYADLQARAQASQAGDVLELRDYPVSVPLTRDEALSNSKPELRQLLLDRAVERMYQDGSGALRSEDGAASPGRFTSAGLVGRSIGFLRDGVHGMLAVLTLILAVVSLLVAAVLVAHCRGFGRAVAVGACVASASLPLLLAGLASRAYATVPANTNGEYLRGELMRIAAQLSWAPVRNGLAVFVLGTAILALGAIAARWSDGRKRFGTD